MTSPDVPQDRSPSRSASVSPDFSAPPDLVARVALGDPVAIQYEGAVLTEEHARQQALKHLVWGSTYHEQAEELRKQVSLAREQAHSLNKRAGELENNAIPGEPEYRNWAKQHEDLFKNNKQLGEQWGQVAERWTGAERASKRAAQYRKWADQERRMAERWNSKAQRWEEGSGAREEAEHRLGAVKFWEKSAAESADQYGWGSSHQRQDAEIAKDLRSNYEALKKKADKYDDPPETVRESAKYFHDREKYIQGQLNRLDEQYADTRESHHIYADIENEAYEERVALGQSLERTIPVVDEHGKYVRTVDVENVENFGISDPVGERRVVYDPAVMESAVGRLGAVSSAGRANVADAERVVGSVSSSWTGAGADAFAGSAQQLIGALRSDLANIDQVAGQLSTTGQAMADTDATFARALTHPDM